MAEVQRQKIKKGFTNSRLVKLDELSDIELIEELWPSSDPRKELIKALLDRRFKKILVSLNETTKRNIEATNRQNWLMIALTLVITIATIILLFR